jgi:hypothetical protein
MANAIEDKIATIPILSQPRLTPALCFGSGPGGIIRCDAHVLALPETVIRGLYGEVQERRKPFFGSLQYHLVFRN